MKPNKVFTPVYLLLAILFLLLTGCMAEKFSLVKNGTVKLIIEPGNNVDIVSADLHQIKSNKIEIIGKLKPHKMYRTLSLFGNVDIKYSNGEGKIYKSVNVPFRITPTHVRKNKETFFKYSEDITLPAGTVVYISIDPDEKTQ